MATSTLQNTRIVRRGLTLLTTMLVLSCAADPSLEDDDLPPDEGSEDDHGSVPENHASTTEEAYRALRRAGYFPNAELAADYPGWQPLIPVAPADPSVLDDAMQEALLLFQHASGLDETGSLDAATLAALRAPRCSVPDYYPPSPVVQERLHIHALHAEGAHVLHDVDAFTDAPDPQAFVPSPYVWPHSELRYGFGAATGDTSLQAQRQALVAALATWTPHFPVIVTERANPDMIWSFLPIHHGPNDSFANEFAHNQFPYGCYWVYGLYACPEPAGDMHINDAAYTWGVGGNGAIQDIQSVALHELGHAFGLAHSSEPNSVMKATIPSGALQRNLGADDIAGIKALYPVFRDQRMFDAGFYLDLNADLAQALGGNLLSASWHWINSGRFEGRAASPVFMVKEYLAANPDLAAAFGTNYPEATWHWRLSGLAEGRAGSPAFQAPDYLNRNQDLKNAFGATNYGAALRHYVESGIAEGRRASPFFDPKHYLLVNPDVAASCGGNTKYRCGLVHWLRNGRAENRVAVP